MASPYNLNRFNLTGFNTTADSRIFAKVTVSEKFRFIIVSNANDVYAKARLYETVSKRRAILDRGRYVKAVLASSINKSRIISNGYFWRHIDVSENVDAYASVLQYFWQKLTNDDLLEYIDTGTHAYSWREAEVEETVDCVKAEGNRYFWQKINSEDTIDAIVKYSAAYLPHVESSDVIGGILKPSEIVFIPVNTDDVVTKKRLASSQVVFDTAESFDLIDAMSSVQSIGTLTCVLTVTLKPGETMIVDASTYNVWIDQENAVYIHSGDWLDELDRNTVSFAINAASGLNNLSASIMYTERYL